MKAPRLRSERSPADQTDGLTFVKDWLDPQKPYGCNLCGKRSKQRSHAIDHERVHTGERPYSCPACLLTFKQKSHLLVHGPHCKGKQMVTNTPHTGEDRGPDQFGLEAFGLARRRLNSSKPLEIRSITKALYTAAPGQIFESNVSGAPNSFSNIDRSEYSSMLKRVGDAFVRKTMLQDGNPNEKEKHSEVTLDHAYNNLGIGLDASEKTVRDKEGQNARLIGERLDHENNSEISASPLKSKPTTIDVPVYPWINPSEVDLQKLARPIVSMYQWDKPSGDPLYQTRPTTTAGLLYHLSKLPRDVTLSPSTNNENLHNSGHSTDKSPESEPPGEN